MNCLNHPDVPAIAYCRECGKPLCEECRRLADGTVYCEQHAPASAWPGATPPPPPTPEPPYTAPDPNPYSAYTAPPSSSYTAPPSSPYTAPPPPPPRDPGASPGLAFLLGFIPGVGAVYNGQYVKGLIHVVILGILIAIVSSDEINTGLEPLFGMMIAVFIFYMAFEAYHTAKRRHLGQPVDEFSSILPRSGHPARFPLAPTILIAAGLLFLLHNLNILRIGELVRYWPLALICLGAYMLYERISGPSEPRNRHSSPGTQTAAEVANDRH